MATKSELEILRVLWKLGPSSVRQVNDEINLERDVRYTSTLKLMQIMLNKGILERDESQMKHVYKPIEEEQKTKSKILDNFVQNFFDGSASKLIIQLTGNKKTSEKELKEIKEILQKLNSKG